jgi:hypothetical protein
MVEMAKKYAAQRISLHVSREYDIEEATNDVISAWAHFIKADIFLMAKSGFSHVPALLSKGCVVYQEYWHSKMPQWISVVESSFDNEGTKSYDLLKQNGIGDLASLLRSELEQCLPRR